MNEIQNVSATSNEEANELRKALDYYLCTGNMAKLNFTQQAEVIKRSCVHYGLESIFRPFELIDFQGIKRLYLTKAGTDMLACVKKLSREVTSYEIDEVSCIGTAMAKACDGERTEMQMACLFMGKFEESFNPQTKQKDIKTVMKKGQELANAKMKLYSIALRRVTLAFIGFPDNEVIEEGATIQAKTIQNPMSENVTYTTKEREPEKPKELVIDVMTKDLNEFLPLKKEQKVFIEPEKLENDKSNTLKALKNDMKDASFYEEVTEEPQKIEEVNPEVSVKREIPSIDKVMEAIYSLEHKEEKEILTACIEEAKEEPKSSLFSAIESSLEVKVIKVTFPQEKSNFLNCIWTYVETLVKEEWKGHVWYKEHPQIEAFKAYMKAYDKPVLELDESLFNEILNFKTHPAIVRCYERNGGSNLLTEDFKQYTIMAVTSFDL